MLFCVFCWYFDKPLHILSTYIKFTSFHEIFIAFQESKYLIPSKVCHLSAFQTSSVRSFKSKLSNTMEMYHQIWTIQCKQYHITHVYKFYEGPFLWWKGVQNLQILSSQKVGTVFNKYFFLEVLFFLCARSILSRI